MGIALSECRRMNLKLPGLELAHQLYTHLQNDGYGSVHFLSFESTCSISAVAWGRIPCFLRLRK